MIREYVAMANTVEEAITIACRELGISEDDCSPEILQMPKKGLFGKIKQQAKVRVAIETTDSLKELLDIPQAAPAQPVSAQAAPAQTAPAQAASAQAVPVQQQPAAPVQPSAPVQEKPAVKSAAGPAAPSAAPASPEVPAAPQPLSAEEIAEAAPKIELAKNYLNAIFEQMGIHGISMTFSQTEGRTVIVRLEGEEIGSVIGKRGETLDAVQYLVCLAANRLEGEYVRFTLNAGNYREKREETLKALAQRMAKKVLKTGRPVALEPMNPYERRIIHAVVTDIDGVFSKSTGEEPNRKVVIKSSRSSGGYRGRGDSSEGREGRRDDRRRSRRQGDRNPDRAQRAAVFEEPAGAPEAAAPEAKPQQRSEAHRIDDDVKLYSRIELD